MIYFDNAATGGFKPNAVLDAVCTAVRYLSANPGRSGHRLSVAGAKALYDCRVMLSQIFNCPAEKAIFTKNCTEALNLAIFGTARKNGKVITTAYEHNSVLRPLRYLESQGIIKLEIIFPQKDKSLIDCAREKISDDAYMLVATAISNVTGYVLPIKELGELAKEKGLLFLVDGAQGGGHIPLDMKELNIDMLALAGHKGLYGVMGSGALLIDEQTQVSPLILGGTGTQSLSPFQPEEYPERLEAGTANLPAIMGLIEGLRFVKNNISSFSKHLLVATERLINGLNTIDGVATFSLPNPAGIVAFSLENITSQELADVLNHDYDIAVRGGLHCAPLAHKLLGTLERGLVRASLAVQNSQREIDYFIKTVKQISTR